MGFFRWWTDKARVIELERQVAELTRDLGLEQNRSKWAKSDNEMYKRLLRDHEKAFRKRNKHVKRLQRRLQDERSRRILAESILEGKDQLLSEIFKKRTND